MEPTPAPVHDRPASDRTTWKHWAVGVAVPLFAIIGAPAIASLPLAVAYTIAGVLAAAFTVVWVLLGRRQS